MNIVLLLSKKDGKLVKDGMMLKDGTEDGTGEVEDGTAKTGVVKNQDGRCLLGTQEFQTTWRS